MRKDGNVDEATGLVTAGPRYAGGFLEYSQRFVLPLAAEGILIVDAKRTRRRTDTSR